MPTISASDQTPSIGKTDRIFNPEQVESYVWLYSINLPTSPLTKLRATPYPEAQNFERTSNGVVIPYSPMSIVHGKVKRDTEGSLPSVSLQVQNVTREMEALFEAHKGLVGERVRIVLIPREELPDGIPLLDEEFEILRSGANEGTVSLELGKYSLYRANYPNRRMGRDFCSHEYGGPGCGYDTTVAGALQTCDKGLDTVDGCTAHGDKEVAAGLARRHPARFLGFRGILRVSGVGANL